jgi:hypothetical protein
VKGGKNRKLRCKHFLPNAPLPFDHNVDEGRHKKMFGRFFNSQEKEKQSERD